MLRLADERLSDRMSEVCENRFQFLVCDVVTSIQEGRAPAPRTDKSRMAPPKAGPACPCYFHPDPFSSPLSLLKPRKSPSFTRFFSFGQRQPIIGLICSQKEGRTPKTLSRCLVQRNCDTATSISVLASSHICSLHPPTGIYRRFRPPSLFSLALS